MGKRQRKAKGESQRPKTRKPKAQISRGGGSGSASAIGTMGALRGGFKGVFGGSKGKRGKPTARSRVLDLVFWGVIVALAYFVISRRFAS